MFLSNDFFFVKFHVRNGIKPDATDCPHEFQRYSAPIDKLKSMIDIKPTVALDFTAIRDKFPCNQLCLQFLKYFVNKFGVLAFIF